MKKLLLFSIFLLGIYNATAQNYYMASPEGFGRNATGGGTPTTANTVTVTDYASLYNAMNSNTTALEAAKVILVSGTITLPSTHTSVTVKNKTIIGLPGAKLVNTIQAAVGSGILYIKPGSNNVIIRNLIFEGPGAWDVGGQDNFTNEGTNVWVDHCEFQDGMDGNFDIKGDADNVTVSWCKFVYNKPPKLTDYEAGGTPDHRFTNLIGSGITDFPADARFSVTFKNCYWAEGCKARMPRARNAELHILNCYYKTSISGAAAVGLGAGDKGTTCYVENCNFEQVAKISDPTTEGSGTTVVKFDGCTKGTTPTAVTGLDVGTATKPTYTYTVLPVTDVVTYVPNASCGAGATLQVSSTGVISTACPNLGIEDYALNGVKLYPTAVNDILNIELSDAISGEATIDIYSITGGKVLATSKKNVSSNDKFSVNVAALTKGIYLCTIKIGKASTTLKFIKE